MILDRELVALLACPKCKGALVEKEGAFGCDACRLDFAIEEGIPNFLLSDAKPYSPADDAEAR